MSWHQRAAADHRCATADPSAPMDGPRDPRCNLVPPSPDRTAPARAARLAGCFAAVAGELALVPRPDRPGR